MTTLLEYFDIDIPAILPSKDKAPKPRRANGVLKRSMLKQLESGPKTSAEIAQACDCKAQHVWTTLTRLGIKYENRKWEL